MLHRKSIDILLYIMILIFPFKRMLRVPFIGGFTISIDDIILLLIILISLGNIILNNYKINIDDNSKKLFPIFFIIFFVLVFLNVFSMFYSPNIRYAFRAVYNTIENMLYYFAVILLISKIKKNYLRIGHMFVLSSIILALSQILYNFGFRNFNYKYNLPNGTIGISFCIGISFLIFYIINSNKKRKIIYISSLIIISIGSYLLGSRSTWLSTSITFIISVLLFIFNRTFLIKGKKNKLIRIIPWLLISIFIFLIPFMVKIWNLLVSIRPVTIFVRFDQWRTVIFNRSILLGNGHGYFYKYYLKYGDPKYINIHGSEHLHNYFLNQYFNIGFFGFLLVLVLFYISLKLNFDIIISKSKWKQGYSIALFSSLVGVIIELMVYQGGDGLRIIWILLALPISLLSSFDYKYNYFKKEE